MEKCFGEDFMTKDNVKILYAVKTTKRYLTRIESILNTWLKDIPDYIFFSDHEDPERNIICASNDSSYLGTLDKSLYFFNNAGKIFLEDKSILDCYDWVFVCDDDTFVNTKLVNDFINDKDTSDRVAYCSVISINNEEDSTNRIFVDYKDVFEECGAFHYYSGGAGILISSNTLKSIDEYVKNGIVYDDAVIGLNLIKNNVELVDSKLFNSQPPEHYGRSDESILEKISYHHIKSERMKVLFDILN